MHISAHGHEEGELVPGTEILLRIDDDNVFSGIADKLRLIPEPSDEPDDPLNWSHAWKSMVIINQAIFVFISILTPLAIAPLTPIFVQEFHTTLPKVNMLFGAAAMALGWANFIIVPCANVFGRRPTILICGLICVLANIWQARVTSYKSFIAARVISGLGAAANESIMPMVVADVMFLHQRGLWMGLYFWAYFIGVFIGPIISGNIGGNVSWRWFFWVCTIAQAMSLVMMIFMFPETRYIRRSRSPADLVLISGSGESASENKITQLGAPNSGSSSPALKPKSSQIITSQQLGSESSSIDLSTRPKGRPSKAQFSIIPTLHFEGKSLIFRDFLAPLQIYSFPIILWATFAFAFTANCLLALNLTQSQVFAAPPYFFTPAQVGFVNFAFVVGGVIGLLTAGPLSDWVSMRATARNNGIREAEMRLIALVPYVCICLIGMVVAAVGYQRHWPWQAIVIIGYGFVGVEVVSIPAIVISYAVDCYKQIPGQIMVSATVIKNTFGFGMIFFYNDWAASAGFIPPLMMSMALGVGITVIGMCIFIPYGKSLRRRTMSSSLHLL